MQHVIPMDTDDEDELGSTMQMPKPTSKANGVATYMPNQKLTRIKPARVEKEPVKQPVEEPTEAVKPGCRAHRTRKR